MAMGGRKALYANDLQIDSRFMLSAAAAPQYWEGNLLCLLCYTFRIGEKFRKQAAEEEEREEKFLGLCEINTFHAFSFFHFLLLTSYDDWIQFDSCSASQHLLPLLLNQFILFFLHPLSVCLTSYIARFAYARICHWLLPLNALLYCRSPKVI